MERNPRSPLKKDIRRTTAWKKTNGEPICEENKVAKKNITNNKQKKKNHKIDINKFFQEN